MPWFKQKLFLVFIVTFVHVTILDLFIVTYNGPVLFWQESLHWLTLATHCVIALIIAAVYEFTVVVRRDLASGKFVLRERVLIGCSMCIVVSIVFLLT